VHADLFRHFFDHHGLQCILTVIEEFALARDDRLADAQDGVLALFRCSSSIGRPPVKRSFT